jgi:hypothetical protein
MCFIDENANEGILDPLLLHHQSQLSPALPHPTRVASSLLVLLPLLFSSWLNFFSTRLRVWDVWLASTEMKKDGRSMTSGPRGADSRAKRGYL